MVLCKKVVGKEKDKKKYKALFFLKKILVESALYVKKKGGTKYETLGMQYGRRGFEKWQKEGVDVITY